MKCLYIMKLNILGYISITKLVFHNFDTAGSSILDLVASIMGIFFYKVVKS